MSMMEPFIPHPKDEETVAAADPGAGAPAQADGVGTEPAGEEFRREGRDPLTHEPIAPPREDDTEEPTPDE
jgi:hypothetical protein